MDLNRLKQETLAYGSALDHKTKQCLSQVSQHLDVDISGCSPSGVNTVITIENVDCLDAVKEMKNGVVLNLASDYCPGGGWGRAMAQEESIFYRTSAYLSLHRELYPLNGSALYSPEVEVYRDSSYKLIYNRWTTSMITCAGIRQPKLINGCLSVADCTELIARITRILKVAMIHGHREIVLGALGCGAFRCPVYDVVHAFKKVLSTYGKFFTKIVFAVLEDRRGTYHSFSREWSTQQ